MCAHCGKCTKQRIEKRKTSHLRFHNLHINTMVILMYFPPSSFPPPTAAQIGPRALHMLYLAPLALKIFSYMLWKI